MTQDLDFLFRQAQQANDRAQYSQARHYSQMLLQRAPQHWDAHLLLTYSAAREGDYGAAEAGLATMFDQLDQADSVASGVLQEAMLCRTRLAYWQENHPETIRRADRGSRVFPAELEFLMMRGKTAMVQQQYDTAIRAFTQVLAQQPDYPDAQRLRDEAAWRTARYQGGILHGQEAYSHRSSSRRTVGVELTRLWNQLSLTGRASQSHWIDVVSRQFELEGLKEVSPRWYLFGQVGISEGYLFPRIRAAVEPFCRIGSTMEVSAGVRYLQYPRQPLWIFTNSVSKYFGQASVMARSFWSPTAEGWRKSFEVGGRWFLPDEYTYVELKLGSGASPDNAYLDAAFQEVYRSQSLYTVLGAQKRFPSRFLGKVWAVFDHQRPTPGDSFTIYSLNAGVWKRF